MKKVFAVLMVMAIATVFVGSALAVPPGKTVEFAGGALGKVVFDGKTHADAGKKCMDCHPKLFEMKKAAKITAPHKPGEFCGSCHDGKAAFAQEGNCAKCHKK
jgi:c(7)-type cytochrome triheme protein